MKKLNSIILFTLLFLNVQSSFSQLPIATTSINIVELGNNEVEIVFNSYNVTILDALIFTLKLDTNFHKFQNISYFNPITGIGTIFNYNPNNQTLKIIWITPQLCETISDGILYKAKLKRIQCGGSIEWEVNNSGYYDCEANPYQSSFIDTKDTLGNCLNSLINFQNKSDYFNTKIFPNPVENKNLHIEYKSIEKGDLTISIIDNLGMIIFSESLINSDLSGELSIDISKIPLGLYYCETLLSTKNGQYKTVKKISIL